MIDPNFAVRELEARDDELRRLRTENVKLRAALERLCNSIRSYRNPAYEDRHYFNNTDKLLAAEKAERAILS